MTTRLSAVWATHSAETIDLDSAIEGERRHERRLTGRDLVLATATPVGLLILWEIAAVTGLVDRRMFTPPSEIVQRGWSMTARGELWSQALPTIGRLSAGFAMGASAGIIVGLTMGVWRPVRAALGATFTALYALPKIAVFPLFLLIFGLTETPKILCVAIAVFFVVQINTLAGIRNIDAGILEAARAYQATGLKFFRYVVLPGATPSIMTGLRVSSGMAVIVVTAVEFVASNSGLGNMIWVSWQLFQPETMFVGLVSVALLGAIAQGLIILLERALLPWRRGRSSK